ncbi:hypothetical protein RYX36_004784 [Vicia faba]
MAKMASTQVKFSLFAVLFIVLAMVVAAHEGHHHMSPAEAPSSYASSLNYHVIAGIVPIFIAILFARNGL